MVIAMMTITTVPSDFFLFVRKHLLRGRILYIHFNISPLIKMEFSKSFKFLNIKKYYIFHLETMQFDLMKRDL